jgi:nicotinamide-nucleotide amidase
MAAGARDRLGSEIGVGITGIAGPDGASAEKPVGLVQLCVATDGTTVQRQVNIPGTRPDVRSRAVTIAMHMVRELLASV